MNKLAIFIVLILCHACSPEKYCDGETSDFSVKVFAYGNNPILGTPLKNMPFVLNVTSCLDFGKSVLKSDTIFTNDKGRIDTMFKGLKITCTEVTRCNPNVQITQIVPPKFVKWGQVINDSYEYKDKAILKVQIKHDSTDVNELFLSASQGSLKLVDTRTTATNKAPINLVLLFNIAKGEDAQLNIQFDKKVVRLDTIKASQLDTIFRLITL